LERGRLDLPNPLARHAHPLTDRLEGHWGLAAQAEAIEEDRALLGREVVQQSLEVLLPAEEAPDGRRLRLARITDDVLQLHALPRPADGRLDRQRHLRRVLERL